MDMHNIISYIDDRNRGIWQYLSNKYIINFRIFDTPNASSRIDMENEKEYTIYLHVSNLCKDIFTHELLHLYIVDKYFDIPSRVELSVMIHTNIRKIFRKEHINSLYNSLTHKLMYPYYKEMGYDVNIFTPILTKEFLYKMGNVFKLINLQKVSYPYYTIALYVCLTIDAICSEWFGEEQKNLLNIFKQKSPTFYGRMKQFVGDWNEKQEPLILKGILDDFFFDLDNWIVSII